MNDVKLVTSSSGLLLACEGDDTSDGSDVNAVVERGSIAWFTKVRVGMDIAMLAVETKWIRQIESVDQG